MNNLQSFALNTLKWITTLCWWLLLLSTAVLFCLAFMFARDNGVIRTSIPVAFRQSGVKVMEVEEDNLNKVITATHGSIHLNFDPTWQNKIIFMLCYAALCIASIIVIYQVRKILKSLSLNQPFHRSNFYRVRVIGLTLVVFFLGEVVAYFLIEKVTLSAVTFNHVKMDYFKDIIILWAGLAMLVLEVVFKRGTDMEEEEQLTI